MFILHRLQRKVFGLKCLTPWWGGILFLILHSLRKKIFWLGIWFGGFAEKKLFWGHDNEYGTTELYCNPHSKNPDWNALKWTLTTCFSRWVLRNDFLVGLVALFNSPLGQNSMAFSGFDWAKLTTDIDQLIFPSLYKEPWMKCLLVLVDTWHRPGLPNESFQPWPSFHGESLPFVFSGWIQWILQMLLTYYRPSQYFAKVLMLCVAFAGFSGQQTYRPGIPNELTERCPPKVGSPHLLDHGTNMDQILSLTVNFLMGEESGRLKRDIWEWDFLTHMLATTWRRMKVRWWSSSWTWMPTPSSTSWSFCSFWASWSFSATWWCGC